MSYVDEFETACNFTRTCFTTFSLDEIKNLSGIISRLRQQSDAVSAFLWKGLSAPDQQILTEHQPSQPTSKQAHITNEQASELVYNEALQEVLRSTREISFHVWLTIATREIIDVTYIS
jgi:hypothetical protein